jgi:primosomal replication protein N
MENVIVISGTIFGNPEFSHEVYGEKFYDFYIDTERFSGTVDTLKCVISEMFVKKLNIGGKNKFVGEIRTRNIWNDGKCHLQTFVFVKEVIEYDEIDENEVELTAIITKKPIYRKTPLGREIADVILANNTRYCRSNYIPTIFWGRMAIKVADLEIGTELKIKGRFQSRNYRKFVDGEYVDKVAYELSVATMEEVE